MHHVTNLKQTNSMYFHLYLLLTKRANDTLVIMRFGERRSQNTSKAYKESADLYKQMTRVHINAFSYRSIIMMLSNALNVVDIFFL